MNSFGLGVVIGVVQTFVLICVLVIGFTIGKRLARCKSNLNNVSNEDNKSIERLEKMNEGISNIMNYDVNVAMGREVSNE